MASFIPNIGQNVINAVVGFAIKLVTKFEAWDFKEQEVKQLVWRQYFVKVLNLTVVVLIRAEMVSNTSWFRSTPLLQFN